MSNTNVFTLDEINQILEQLNAHPGARLQYIGSRYVPKFAKPEQWSNANTYEPLTIVTNEGNSFTSKQYVPAGIDINNTEYWAETGNYNAQIEQYRQEVAQLTQDLNKLENEVNYISLFSVPEQFGAIGDGIGDDSNAISEWLSSGPYLALTPGKEYLCAPFTIPATVKLIHGYNAALKEKSGHSGYFITIAGDNCDISNIVIDCNENAYGVTAQATRCTLKNSRIKNFTNTGLQTVQGSITSGYEMVFDTLFIQAKETAQYGVAVDRADCLFTNIVTQDCIHAFRFTQGSTLLNNIHSWIRPGENAFSGSNMFSIFTPDAIMAVNVYCDSIEALVNVPTTVSPSANVSIKNTLMLAQEGTQQFICRCYSGTANTYGVNVEYGYFPGRPPKTYTANTFKGRAEPISRITADSELLNVSNTNMQNLVGWGYQSNIPNTPNTGLSAFYQISNFGYFGYFDLTTTAEITQVGNYVAIGDFPPIASSYSGIRTAGICQIGDKTSPIALDYDEKKIKRKLIK